VVTEEQKLIQEFQMMDKMELQILVEVLVEVLVHKGVVV
jgi:hypothetical protein